VLNQIFKDFEVLIIDDASSDDTDAVVAAMDDARLK
jgi:glycosyltransferase involved in cell wall biosynthesis